MKTSLPLKGPERFYFFVILGLGLLVRVWTAWSNPGFVAFDDYQSMIRLLIPAQDWSWAGIVAESELRSPWARVPLWAVAKFLAGLGVTDSLTQLRCLGALVGAFFVGAATWFCWEFSRIHRAWAVNAWLLLMGFAWMPWLGTRMLFESLTIPWIFLALACHLGQSRVIAESKAIRLRILWSLAAWFCWAMACVYRAQVALMALPFLFLLRPGWVSWMGAGLSFVGLGFLEQFTRGSFHKSLLDYLKYNLAHSSEYGVYPWYFYFPLLLVLVLPLFVLRIRRQVNWAEPWFVALACSCGLFFVGHSLVPHKEERFLFSMLPLVLVLLAGFVEWTKWRAVTFWTMQFLAVALFASHVTQHNVIAAVRSMPMPDEVLAWRDSVGVWPAAYVAKSRSYPVRVTEMDGIPHAQRGRWFVVREDLLVGDLESWLERQDWIACGSTKVSWLEKGVIALNPRANVRRNSLVIYGKSGCVGYVDGSP